MDGKAMSSELKLFTNQEHGNPHPYVLFDHSGSSLEAFHNVPKTRFGDLDHNHMKLTAFDVFGKVKAARGNSPVSHEMAISTDSENSLVFSSSEMSGFSDEDPDVKSDADSLFHDGLDAANGISNEEACMEDLLNEEGARRKLEILAKMVGMESTDACEVLEEVVRVLKSLESRTRGIAEMKDLGW